VIIGNKAISAMTWQTGVLIFFRTVSQILTAGIAITAFSLLLYALTLNLKDRVVRIFATIMFWVVVVFSSESIGSVVKQEVIAGIFLKIQWVGIIMMPASYLHFSDVLLAMTGKPSRWKRVWAVRLSYLASIIFLITLGLGIFVGDIVISSQPAPHLAPTFLTGIFTVFYLILMGMSWYNFARAYLRTTTSTSRRRMGYLIFGALAPAFGSFPYLLYGSDFASQHTLTFWILAAFSNLLVGAMIVVMAYSIAFFGVTWPDRVVKRRLFKWIMRGPVTAIITLGITTVVRRIGVTLGSENSALVPIIMAATIVLSEYFITVFSPFWEAIFFYRSENTEMALIEKLETRLITQNDLIQFLEVILAAVCDRFQSPGAYLAVFNGNGLETIVRVGKAREIDLSKAERLLISIGQGAEANDVLEWGDDIVLPVWIGDEEQKRKLVAIIGVIRKAGFTLDKEDLQAFKSLADRAAIGLRDRQLQQTIFQSFQEITPGLDLVTQVRAAGRYDGLGRLAASLPAPASDMSQWVKDALVHYWGGPKLTESPLLQLKIVEATLGDHEGNQTNALRAVLRDAIEKVRPDGERRYTGDWILYNILRMKFLEGKKVREVALQLAMSEADLYRKQRIAIEEVAKAIYDMEIQATNSDELVLDELK
jgi:hypothetical protein